MRTANIFTHYKQLEDQFTNGFVSILALSRLEAPDLVASFLREELDLAPEAEIDLFRVLPGEDGRADGELSGAECCIWLETKITSGILSDVQIRRHLYGDSRYAEGDDRRGGLMRRPERFKRLILLTPDDSGSTYIKHFLSIDATSIVHLEWKRAYAFLERFVKESSPSTFSELVQQFLSRIHDRIFTQDMAGVILKIAFGDKSEVYADSYLDELEAGTWTRWNTPREYKNLDGTGRKLLLYDPHRKAITVEVEIKSVARTDSEGPVRNLVSASRNW